MKEMFVKRRSRVKSKEAKRIIAWMDDEYGIEFEEKPIVEMGSLNGDKAYIMKGRIVAIEETGHLMLTLHGIMELKPRKRWVTVDMGAVKFLANGADVMSPGIIDADPEIEKDDLVWVRDEKNGRPLCVGRSLTGGPEMVRSDSGKAVKTVHFVGDPIWNAEL